MASVDVLPADRLHVDPVNPRPEPGDVTDLAASIADIGIVNPLIVRTNADGYGVLSGSRRLAAARAAGVDEVPAIVRDVADDRQALAIATAENVGRQAMDPIAEARAYQRLIDESGMSQREVGRQCGVSEFTVSTRLQLLGLPEDKQQRIASGDLSIHRAYNEIKRERNPVPTTRKRKACDCTPESKAPRGCQMVALPNDAVATATARAQRAGLPLRAWITDAIRRA